MGLYTYESARAIKRVAGKQILVDTSYLQCISDSTDSRFPLLSAFHGQALARKTRFVVNAVVRQEFMTLVRKTILVETILARATTDPAADTRYRAALGQPTKALTATSLKHGYERIYKDHLKADDLDALLSDLPKDIWAEVQQLEIAADVSYVPSGDTVSWDRLGEIIALTGLAVNDAMNVNFALSVEADGMVTADCDYAVVAELLDVFVPAEVAAQCVAYDAALD